MPAKFSLFIVAALPIIPIALACGGDDTGMIMVRPDAMKAIDAAPVVCTGGPTYGAVPVAAGSSAQFAGSDGSNANYQIYWGGRADTMQPTDILQVSLRNGVGPFASGIVPATVQLTGPESAFETCAACTLLLTDITSDGMGGANITDIYMPTAGTLTLTETGPENVVGSITGLVMQHMLVSGNMLVPANDGCTATFGAVTMDAMMSPQEMMATGKPGMSLKFKLPNRTY